MKKPATRPEFFDAPIEATSRGWHFIAPLSECPKQFQFARVRKVRPRQANGPSYLAVGQLVHAARAQWFYDGMKGDLWRAVIARHAERLAAKGEHVSAAVQTEAIEHMAGYVAYWKARVRPVPLAVEHAVTKEIEGHTWTARYDAIVRYAGKVWINELKTTAKAATWLSGYYQLHGQPLMQMTLWGDAEIKRFGPLEGVLVDPLYKANKHASKGAEPIRIRKDTISHALRFFPRQLSIWAEQAKLITWDADVERRFGRACERCSFKALCMKGRDGALGYVTEDGKPLHHWKHKPGQRAAPWE